MQRWTRRSRASSRPPRPDHSLPRDPRAGAPSARPAPVARVDRPRPAAIWASPAAGPGPSGARPSRVATHRRLIVARRRCGDPSSGHRCNGTPPGRTREAAGAGRNGTETATVRADARRGSSARQARCRWHDKATPRACRDRGARASRAPRRPALPAVCGRTLSASRSATSRLSGVSIVTHRRAARSPGEPR